MKHKLSDQIVEFKEDRSVFARMLLAARSRPVINLKASIGQHEFTSLPQALFAASSELLPWMDKSKLMNILEELPAKMMNADQAHDDH